MLIPLLKLGVREDALLETLERLIKEGEAALKVKDREKAERNFRRMKWLYVQMEGKGIKGKAFHKIKKYHKKIKGFSEF